MIDNTNQDTSYHPNDTHWYLDFTFNPSSLDFTMLQSSIMIVDSAMVQSYNELQ